MHNATERYGASSTSPDGESPAPTIPSALDRITAAIERVDRALVGTGRLLDLFDHFARAVDHYGAQALALTIFSARVEHAFETARLWAAARHCTVETFETQLSNGTTRKTMRVIATKGHDLFRVSFASHEQETRVADARDRLGVEARGRK